ncbi:zinc-binding alcohol dehydrogenase family protein [Inquilinus sp.]|uniref:zinc-binding alcohol dehydrogenase family protein n=1 Tax=Inquilinus sp. TaxID=1932117 RepID=UPI0031D15CE5
MKAILCEKPETLRLIDRPEPQRRPGEVLVRIRRVGICGTDYHIYKGNQPYFEYPRVIGHELGAEVVEADAGSAFRPGQVVAIQPYLHCGTCGACRRGRTNCCRTLSVLGVHRDGGLCEFLSLPEENVVPAEGLSVDQAAMVEFLAIGAHGIRRGAPGAGDRVLVVGAGPIGIAATIFAKLRGAHVSVLDLNAGRLAFSRDVLKADAVFEGGGDIDDRLKQATDGEFFDLVVDATGSPAAMHKGFSYVGHAGSYVLLSIVMGEIGFSDPEFHKRETTLLASRNATREDFEHVLASMKAGHVPTAALGTHRGALAEVPALVPGWSRPEAGVIKALVEV